MNQELKEHARLIHASYHEYGGKLEIIIHKTSKTNMTWRYSIRLWFTSPNTKLVDYWHLNGAIAELTGQKLTKDGYLTGNGIGAERSFQVAYMLGLICAEYGYGHPENKNLPNDKQIGNGYQFNRYTLTA